MRVLIEGFNRGLDIKYIVYQYNEKGAATTEIYTFAEGLIIT